MAQPHRGERVLLGTRVPSDMAEIVKDAAKRQGFRSVSDYLMVLAAEATRFPVQDPRNVDRGQTELPLQNAS